MPYGSDLFEAFSVGLDPKGINPIHAAGHGRARRRPAVVSTPTSVSEYLGKAHFGYLITLCGQAEQNCPRARFMGISRRSHWDLDDPAAVTGTDEEKLAKYRVVRDQVEARVRVGHGAASGSRGDARQWLNARFCSCARAIRRAARWPRRS